MVVSVSSVSSSRVWGLLIGMVRKLLPWTALAVAVCARSVRVGAGPVSRMWKALLVLVSMLVIIRMMILAVRSLGVKAMSLSAVIQLIGVSVARLVAVNRIAIGSLDGRATAIGKWKVAALGGGFGEAFLSRSMLLTSTVAMLLPATALAVGLLLTVVLGAGVDRVRARALLVLMMILLPMAIGTAMAWFVVFGGMMMVMLVSVIQLVGVIVSLPVAAVAVLSGTVSVVEVARTKSSVAALALFLAIAVPASASAVALLP